MEKEAAVTVPLPVIGDPLDRRTEVPIFESPIIFDSMAPAGSSIRQRIDRYHWRTVTQFEPTSRTMPMAPITHVPRHKKPKVQKLHKQGRVVSWFKARWHRIKEWAYEEGLINL
jgi:hypothetical protein